MSDIRSEEEQNIMEGMKLCHSIILAKVVKAAFDLGVFEVLATASSKAGMTALEVAGNLPGCSQEKSGVMIENILGYLAAHSLLTCTVSSSNGEYHSRKQYGVTPVTRLLANNQNGVSLGPYMRMNNLKECGDSWDQMKEAVQEGVIPFEKAHGVSLFELMAKSPSFNKAFNEGMSSNSTIVIENVVENYDGFKQITELVDVGGGVGTCLNKIISKYPHIKGINFDQPHVISTAPSFPGVQHVGGDMFTTIPSGKAILLKWILHDWNSEKCIIILRNCWKALPTSGKVIVVEQILPEVPEENVFAQNTYTGNIVMGMCFHSKERTEKEFRSLAQEAGFSEFKVSLTALSFKVMELVK